MMKMELRKQDAGRTVKKWFQSL